MRRHSAALRRNDDHLGGDARQRSTGWRWQSTPSEDAVAPDFDFHRTIAEATGNPHFTHLFSYLGSLLIPRARLQTFRYLRTRPHRISAARQPRT